MITFLLLIVVGLFVWYVANPNQFRQTMRKWFRSLREKWPILRQAMTSVFAFVQKYLVIILVLIVIASILITTFWPRNTTPHIGLGLNQLNDKCDVLQTVNVTTEDLRRGLIVVGSVHDDGKDCRRIINLIIGD